MERSKLRNVRPLGFQWQTQNPFLFCVHHQDAYPKGNENMEPIASLEGRSIGHDFVPRDGWRMYHGKKVPGFPVHPHRGFETITIVLEGLVDHADSLGAAGRYGHGDVQWMTAGAGIQHTEMFPLINTQKENPLELFQIWLNLPAADKFANPHYKMLWREEIPIITLDNSGMGKTRVRLIAGKLNDRSAVPPPPDSWASVDQNEVAIYLVEMEANAEWTLPSCSEETMRSLYFYKGDKLNLDGEELKGSHAADIGTEAINIKNSHFPARFLVLQGRPIQEPIAQYGPFVMNTQSEIQQTIEDYRKSEFGGWPWPRPDQVHDPALPRFASFADGTKEERPL